MATESQILTDLTPSVEEFAAWRAFSSVEEFDAPVPNIEAHLRLAAALLYLATGLKEVPSTDTALGTLIRAGIFDMAWYIGTSLENRDEAFSPFSSERIGSYSYSKAVRAVGKSEETGVPFFDMAVAWFAKTLQQSQAEVEFALTSEHVFYQPYERFRALDALLPYVFEVDATIAATLNLIETDEPGLYEVP